MAIVPQRDKKLRVLFIPEDSWCGSIYFLLGANESRYKAWIKEVFGREDKDCNHAYFTTEIHQDNGGTVDVIAFRDEKWDWNMQQMACLVHECHHLTTNILLRKGLKHSRETEEAWAYLQDSIYLRICWAMKNPDKVQRLSRVTNTRKREKVRSPKRRKPKLRVRTSAPKTNRTPHQTMKTKTRNHRRAEGEESAGTKQPDAPDTPGTDKPAEGGCDK